jgi:hypothetical protein
MKKGSMVIWISAPDEDWQTNNGMYLFDALEKKPEAGFDRAIKLQTKKIIPGRIVFEVSGLSDKPITLEGMIPKDCMERLVMASINWECGRLTAHINAVQVCEVTYDQ